ncbi:Protein kinase-like domain [Phytophthora cactorum]|nr:Protein kinase-like domain [Phytophthora cactorum]
MTPRLLSTRTRRSLLGLTLLSGGAYAVDEANAKILSRSLRVFVTGGQVVWDYRLHFKGTERDDPDYRSKLQNLNQRIAQRLLHLCFQNGGIYTKFGQQVATFNHGLPKEYTETLAQLQDQASPRKWGPWHEIFKEFDQTPIASASWLKCITLWITKGENWLSKSTCFKNNSNVHVPVVYDDLSTKRMMSMEFITAPKISQIEAIRELGLDPPEVARVLCEVFSEMVFFRGFVHCDPHAGNIFVRRNPDLQAKRKEQIVLLDHGLYRELDGEFRKTYCDLWSAMLMRNSALLDDCVGG